MKNDVRFDGDHAYIRLRRKTGPDLEAVIDKSQLSLLSRYLSRWSAIWSPTARTHYVKTTVSGPAGKDKSVYMHRVLAQAADDVIVRHIDGDGLNNRISNLEITSRTRPRPRSESEGVKSQRYANIRRLRNKLYQARVRLDGKFIELGHYIDLAGAERAVASFREAVSTHVSALRNRPAARAGRIAAAAAKYRSMRRAVRKLINSDPKNDVRFSREHLATLKQAAREYRERNRAEGGPAEGSSTC